MFAKSLFEHGLPNPLIIEISGTGCDPFSSVGKREHTHSDMLFAFFLWAPTIRKNRVGLVTHENAELRSLATLSFFRDDHCHVTTFYLSPWVRGWLVRRPRMYSVLVLREQHAWHGSETQFLQFPQQASETSVCAYLRRSALRRGYPDTFGSIFDEDKLAAD